MDLSNTRGSAKPLPTAYPQSNERPVLKIVPVSVRGPKGVFDTFALLDDGSTATLMESSVADAIGANGRSASVRVEAIGGMSKEVQVSMVDIAIKGRHIGEWFPVSNVRAVPHLGLKCQTAKSTYILSLNHLSDLAGELSHVDAKPTILIGADNWHLLLPQTVRRGSVDQPVAVLSALGWALFGSLKGKSGEALNCLVNHLSCGPHSECLDRQVGEYFRLDSIGITSKNYYSRIDELAVKTLEATTERLLSGRFETGLLWRPDVTSVPDSFDLAKSRFLSLERKFKRDPTYAEEYRAQVNAMLAKGYAEKCERVARSGVLWYLPHFGVIHPQKGKLRVVHDAAATCGGTSLNSLLLAGPDLLRPLLAILMRFREGRFALHGDIKEMFPQTKIRLEDRDAQRFLWREDPSMPLTEYRMSSMMFGAVSSPFTALYLKNKNAEEHRDLFPDAVDAIIEDHYMDDFLGSVDSLEAAKRLAVHITHVHAQACLEMRGWVSNTPEALSMLPPEVCASTDPNVDIRVLGVQWDVTGDTLHFNGCGLGTRPSQLTKRSVLSHLMKVYDPLGFLTPLVIRGRILFQRCWKLGIDWDQDLPAQVAGDWNEWFKSCEVLLSGGIPRHYASHRSHPTSSQLHIFADASELAYACVAYWRFEWPNGEVLVSLIGGKARVAPVKAVSIPRLELQAALIAARFSNYILEAHRCIRVAKVFLWTDSQTVLRWLRSDSRSFKPFVAHRVGEIAETTSVLSWKYVPTTLNVADDATRFNKRFEISSRWFTGPFFLMLTQSDWPVEPDFIDISKDVELKRLCQVEVLATIDVRQLPLPVVPNATRFSVWLRLVRACARVFVYVRCFKLALGLSKKLVCREITPSDISTAEDHLMLQSQLGSFRMEYTCVFRGQPLEKIGRLKNLALYIDSDSQLLKLSGRIGAVLNATSVTKDPIVLCGKNRIVRLLIASYHERAAHGSNELVVNELHQKYYIIGLRPAVRSVATSCLRCRIRKSSPLIPTIGDLPPERLAHCTRPFTYVGLDYFGPLSVSVGRHTEKRYVALFTCLTVRAVHLEIVMNLSSDSAIMALRRFIARRGVPAKLFSDNGTAFVGANRLLKEEKFREFAVNMKIEWVFIPPGAPFMGGCWERLIGGVKRSLSATLFSRSPKEEVLFTFLLEAESLLNSRPLTHVAVTPGEEEAITPFHFLIGTSSVYTVVGQQDDSDLIRRVAWKKGMRLADHFWTRWVREYLPTLIPRKPPASSRNLMVGDQVLVADGNLPRGVWPRGRVTKTFPGRDGVVRVVELLTKNGSFRRPVRKLVPLPK